MRTKELVQSVLASMQRDKLLYEQDGTTTRRKNFYSVTQQPFHIAQVKHLSDTHVIKELHYILKNIVTGNTGYSVINVHSIKLKNRNPLMVEVDMTAHFSWRHEHYKSDDFVKSKEVITTKRATKFSTVVDKLVKAKGKFFDLLRNDKYAFNMNFDEEEYAKRVDRLKRETTSDANSRVKHLINTVKAEENGMWVYFTTTNIAQHYLTLETSQSIKSCMSYPAKRFGSTYNGEDRHPLQGYEYSPDFRLALISFYSPDEIVKVNEYPFLARAIVFPTPYNTDKKFAFSTVYGHEQAQKSLRYVAEYIEKPDGFTVYGVLCNGLTINSNHCTTDRWVADRYDSEEDINHIIAPFIDTRNNLLYIEEGSVPFVREDGIKVVELRTGCLTEYDSEDEDEDEDTMASIYYASGIVYWLDRQNGELGECYLHNGQWKEGRYD